MSAFRSAVRLCRPLLLGSVLAVAIAGCSDDDDDDAPFTPDPEPTSPPASTYAGTFVRDYFDLLCRVVKSTGGFFPPQAARAYGYTGIAAYEAVVPGIEGATSLDGQLNGWSVDALPQADPALTYDWSIAANAAIAGTMRRMVEKRASEESLALIDGEEAENLEDLSLGVSAEVVARSVAFGEDVAAAVYAYSMTDGGHESYLDPFQLPYEIPDGAEDWVPTGAVLTPIAPYWGACRPFLAVNLTHTQPIPPEPFSTEPGSAFHREAMQVYEQVRSNTLEEVEIARYWADDPFNTCTPTGHTFNILTQLLAEARATLAKTALGYAMLGIAENDAFIACWKTKYDHTLIRPVSYIQRYIDPTFQTVIGTPPFPAYSSGHSAEIGAGTRVFTRLFTDGSGNYEFTDFSQLQYGFPARNFRNFHDLAEECANSRFYGGIHYVMDNVKGLQTGRAVGDNVSRLIVWPLEAE
jgi:hypothetical protein